MSFGSRTRDSNATRSATDSWSARCFGPDAFMKYGRMPSKIARVSSWTTMSCDKHAYVRFVARSSVVAEEHGVVLGRVVGVQFRHRGRNEEQLL